MIKTYYKLAKPGIIYGNSLPAMAGFFLASSAVGINLGLFIAMLLGLALVIGGSCVFNNYLDRDIDVRMERTKHRATVTGEISKKNILAYGTILLLLGILILYFFTNLTTLVAALVGVISYLVLYTPLKRTTVHSPLVGSIAGAMPIVVGYTAVTNTFNLEALILFFILVFWQMPHFYAIAMYKHKDYDAAEVPVLPSKKGILSAKIHILVYIILFTATSSLLTFFNYTGFVYLIGIVILGLIWFILGVNGFRKGIDDMKWARKMFLFSLIVMILLSLLLAVGAVLI